MCSVTFPRIFDCKNFIFDCVKQIYMEVILKFFLRLLTFSGNSCIIDTGL